MNHSKKEKLYTLKEACEQLGISAATGRNWVKSGRLTPKALTEKKGLYFSHNHITKLQEQLCNPSVRTLKSRRNKTYITGTHSCHAYIEASSVNHLALDALLSLPDLQTDSSLTCILRDCAEKLITKSGAELSVCVPLLRELADDITFHQFMMAHSSLSGVDYSYVPGEDTLGFLYLSLRSLKSRKGSGSYYTPVWLAKHLITEHLLPFLPKAASDTSVLDPSCGSGMFLLQLPQEFPLENLYGTDMDSLSVTLTRINLALKYKVTSATALEQICQNIIQKDFLSLPSDNEMQKKYDVILGNPPWGARLSAAQKKDYQKHLHCATGSSVESFDLFLEQSLKHLTTDGIFSFVLPEAVLSVKSHRLVRALLLRYSKALSIEYLGEAFEQVHCPSILLTIQKPAKLPSSSDDFSLGTRIITKSRSFLVETGRKMTADGFSFALSDKEYTILEKLTNQTTHTTLKGQADFALGIVTGNNARFLHAEKTQNTEPFLRGSDISKYHINSHSGYLQFNPSELQQTAPEHLYRSDKLLYRFISKKLVFAYDAEGLLSLNSCNVVIPHIPGMQIKYILAVLNSNIAQFVFEKRFSSVKVLRSHLESLPIPLADTETQNRIISLVDLLMASQEKSQEYQQIFLSIERELQLLYGLTDEEYAIVTTAICS